MGQKTKFARLLVTEMGMEDARRDVPWCLHLEIIEANSLWDASWSGALHTTAPLVLKHSCELPGLRSCSRSVAFSPLTPGEV